MQCGVPGSYWDRKTIILIEYLICWLSFSSLPWINLIRKPGLDQCVSYLQRCRWFPLSSFLREHSLRSRISLCLCYSLLPLCCWCLDWFLSPIFTHSPASCSSDLLVAEAGISFVFVLGISLSPVLDSACWCSQGEVIVIINVACPLSSADWFLLMFWPPEDLGHTELEKWSKYGLRWTK